MENAKHLRHYDVASPKTFGESFDLKRATVFCSGHRLSPND